jgi:hypothetical protein
MKMDGKEERDDGYEEESGEWTEANRRGGKSNGHEEVREAG